MTTLRNAGEFLPGSDYHLIKFEVFSNHIVATAVRNDTPNSMPPPVTLLDAVFTDTEMETVHAARAVLESKFQAATEANLSLVTPQAKFSALRELESVKAEIEAKRAELAALTAEATQEKSVEVTQEK